MAIGSSLGITLPTQNGNSGTWGTDLNKELQKIIDAVEAQVPASAIDFSADFNLNSYGLTSVNRVAFDALSTAPTDLRSAYFDSSGNFYVINGSGTAVQLTSGSGLSGAGGSITGAGYGSSGIELNWDGTNYDFKDGSGADDFAPIEVGSLRLNDGSSNQLIHRVGSMSSNYTLTWPSAVAGGADYLLASNGSGGLSWTNSISAALALSGKVTFSGGTAHGDRILGLTGAAFRPEVSTATYQTSGNIGLQTNTSGSQSFMICIPLKEGDQIKSIVARGSYIAATQTFSCRVLDTAGSGTTTSLGSTTEAGTGYQDTTLNVTDHTLASGEMLVFNWDAGASAGDVLYGISVTYDRP